MSDHSHASQSVTTGPRQCEKLRYPNQGIALRALRNIQSRGRSHNKEQRAYWCDNGCGAWHLTSQPLRSSIELDDAAAENQLRELKTYESADVARAGVFVAAAVPDVGGTASVDDLAERWKRRYPRHAVPGAKKSVKTRLHRGLRALDVVGIVSLDQGSVTVLDLDGLEMVAQNLEVLEDRSGYARRPSKWPRSPEVPPHLRTVQSSVIAAGLVGWKRVGNGIGEPDQATPADSLESIGESAEARESSPPGEAARIASAERTPLARLARWLAGRLGRTRSTSTSAKPK